MMKKLLFFGSIMLIAYSVSTAKSLSLAVQVDSSKTQLRDTTVRHQYYKLDSATRARRLAIKDSIKAIGDSLAIIWIKKPNPNRPNKFIDSLIKVYQVEKLDFVGWAKKFSRKSDRYHEGKSQPKGQRWIIAVLLFLMALFGIVKLAFSKELMIIIQSFYSNRVLGQISKEDNFFTSWSFMSLYVMFGLTIGVLLYLLGESEYFHFEHAYNGFQWFLILSAAVIVLFTLKIIVLRLFGFFFGIEKLVNVYVSILYLTYFNSAIVFLPLIVVYSLAPHRYSETFGYISMLMLTIIFVFQFLRAGANILYTYPFPKVYLFLYLCALEICPLLILIKALRF